MEQKIENIKVSDLRLWTENPRDPIKSKVGDLEILLQATEHKKGKWNLAGLIKKMGDYYDNSELPTVVKKNNKYVVYDGNRRLAIIKYSQNPLWKDQIKNALLLPENLQQNLKTMLEVPCNVCNEETALTNIERKHINSGTWKALERSYFSNRHRKQPKDNLLIIEESVGNIISNNKSMNQRFVKEEVLTTKNLRKIGFNTQNGELSSNYDENKVKSIFASIVELISNKTISTRGDYREQLLEPLKENYPDLDLEEFNENNTKNVFKMRPNENETPISPKKAMPIFGQTLKLMQGDTNDIYSDIKNLYKYYLNTKRSLSENFHILIRMALRLLVESATTETKGLDHYIKENFAQAKQKLTKDEKTTLANHSVSIAGDLIKLGNYIQSYT